MTNNATQSINISQPYPSGPFIPGIVIGTGAALGMWVAWLATHAPAILSDAGGTASSTVTAVAVATVMVLIVALGSSRAGGAKNQGWKIGLVAGGISGLMNLMLLGSFVSVQPDTTDQMREVANRLRDDAPMIVGGFLAISLAAGAIAGLIGEKFRKPAREPRPGEWLARLAITTMLSMVPLIIIGGAVTSTESGMAVPDGVTSYGAVSVLFPLSLMAEPRIFLEHSHRLFGMLVGVNAITLMAMTMYLRREFRVIGLIGGLALVGGALGAVMAQQAGAIGANVSVALIGLAGLAGLGFTHAMLSHRKFPAAAAGLLALVIIQGLLGKQRVDDNLLWIAMFHGLFAQFVVFTAVMLAGALSPTFTTLPGGVTQETWALGARVYKLAKISLVLVTLQLALGAASRHMNGAQGGSHVTITHAANSFLVVGVVIILAALCTKGDSQTEMGKVLKRIGAALMAVLAVQFLLGWAAVGMVGIGRESRPIPGASELATAHAIPLKEAIVTTSHQVGGAALMALVTLAATWARRAKRATESELAEPYATEHESESAPEQP